MSDLRKMARDAGFNVEFDDYVIDHWKRFEKLAELIKDAALAQERSDVQPEQLEPYTSDVPRIMREAGMTFHLGLPHKAVVEQMTRVVDLVCAEASIKAAQQFSAALAQPEQGPVAWLYSEDERVWLTMSEYEARENATHGITPLYEHPPQRKPLTEEEIGKATEHIAGMHCAIVDEIARAIEAAHGIGGEHE